MSRIAHRHAPCPSEALYGRTDQARTPRSGESGVNRTSRINFPFRANDCRTNDRQTNDWRTKRSPGAGPGQINRLEGGETSRIPLGGSGEHRAKCSLRLSGLRAESSVLKVKLCKHEINQRTTCMRRCMAIPSPCATGMLRQETPSRQPA